MTDNPLLHEQTDGARFNPEWAGQLIDVTPQEIRERLRFPAKYAYASLAPSTQPSYDPAFWNVAQNYYRRWPIFRQHGTGPVFVGGARSGTSWTAAAVANEIVRHATLRGMADLNVSWLSTFHMLRTITDAMRCQRYDMYISLRDSMWRHSLVIVDDLLGAQHVEGGVQFLHSLYAARYDANLPTVTTITSTSTTSMFWLEVQALFGRTFTDRLKGSSAGLVALHGAPI